MAVTLDHVVRLAELDLRVCTPGSGLGRPLRWVAVSEQADPTPWIETGDLLLTTGMTMDVSSSACAAYVERLVAAGAAGLGFGVGLHHDEVPAVLVDAAERCGLPVLEIGRPVPFVAVSRAVSRLLAAEEYAESGASFDAQRRMIRAVLAARGEESSPAEAAISALARHVRGFALHLGVNGEVLDAAPADAVGRASELLGEVDRLRPRGLLGSASVVTADEHIVLVPVGVRDTVQGFLAVGSPRALTTADQAVLNLAVSLLSWQGMATASARAGMGGWRAALMDLIALQGLTSARAAQVGLGAVDPTRAVAFAVHSRPGSRADAARWAIDGDDVLLGVDSDTSAIGIAAVDDEGRLPACIDHLGVREDVQAIGVSDVTDLTDAVNVRQALAQAREAARGVGVQRYSDLGGRSIGSLVDAATASTWAAAYLAPLLQSAEGGELLQTLHAWLGQHGQVDATAQQLGIHRHTVRHRIRRAEAICGRPLDDPGVRADLWFALAVVDPTTSATAGSLRT